MVQVLLTLLVFIICSCQWETPRAPSILVIAVDSLPSDQVSCTDLETAQAESGFGLLCSESVRFTHAYTPSVMAQPALASLLTSKWPVEHGVIHNGQGFLKASFATSAEAAYKRGFRTLFLSGGAPIWKKSGLDQGFEVFDDNVVPAINKFYINFDQHVDTFLNWLEKESSDTPFFSFFYVPDLQYFYTDEVDSDGRPVAKSYEGRFARFDSRLAKLIEGLKSQHRWDDTYIILAGLNGRARFDRDTEIEANTLLSENSQVALLIKPLSKKRDLGIQWKIDANVSLTDVGRTIFELIGEPITSNSSFPVVSLVKTLSAPDVDWDLERPILIHSGWSVWRADGRPRMAIRKGHFLFVHDFPPKIFNSLTDRLEARPSGPSHERWAETIHRFAEDTVHLKSLPWTPDPAEIFRKVQVARSLWTEDNLVSFEGGYEHAVNNSRVPDQVAGWLALRAIEKSEWHNLAKLGKKYNSLSWSYLAAQHLKQKAPLPPDACFKVMAPAGPDLKTCEDPLFRELVSWIRLGNSGDGNFHKEAFLRAYRQHLIDRRIGQLNYINGLVWDLPMTVPSGPAPGEILLHLPENHRYLSLAQERVRSPL